MRLFSVRPWAVPVAAAVCLLMLQTPVLAGNGKLAGTVTDGTGAALPGANVVTTTVIGSKLGAITDEQGRYFIINVPPGVYTVEASYIGHQTVQVTEVDVRLDLTSTVDFQLPVQAIQGEVVTVTADRLAVEKSLTTSRSTIGAAELNNSMPVADLHELVNTTPSVFRGYIRGGRKADSKVLVDGIDVSDTYFRAGEGAQTNNGYVDVNRSSGSEFTAVGINSSTVQALDIVAGTFNAEYDAASAGIVNVVTRDGGDQLAGRVFIRRGLSGVKNAGPDVYAATADTATGQSYFDKYEAERARLLGTGDAADAAKAQNYYVFAPGDVDYGDNPATEMEVSVGGPLGLPRTSFYLTARYMDDQGLLPNAEDKTMRYSLKLTHGLTESIKLTGNMMIDDGGELGGWVNRSFSGKYAYYPQGSIGNRKLGTMGYLGINHMLSPSTFYEIKLSQVTRSTEYGYADDDGDGIVEIGEDGDFIIIDSEAESEKYLGVDGSGADAQGNFTFFTTNPGNSRNFDLPFGDNQYRLAQPGFYYEDLQRDVLQLKGDLTSQLNYNHQIKTGFLLRRHTVAKFMQRTQVTVGYSNMPFEVADYEVNPMEMALYVQDKIEYGGVIVNAGLRLDGLDVDAQQLTDFFAPSEEAQYEYGSGAQQTYRRPIRGEDVDVKWFLQPRLGVSHPISENAAMHYSWGKFYSPPSFSDLYEDYNSFTNPSWPTLYDVDADPTTATAYEMGLSYRFHPDYLLDVTAYYRDIQNYSRLGFTISPTGAGFANYTFNTTGGYADSRGFEIALERRPVDRISGRINYAYSYIKASRSGNNSTPFPNQTSFSANSDVDKANLDVVRENTETFNTYLANVSGGGNPLVSGYDRTHRLSLTLMALLPADVSMSLISTAESGFHYSVTATTDDPRARETDTAPWNLRTDVRFGRTFPLMGLDVGAFLEVRNLLDRENILTYDNRNIPSQTIWEQDQKPDGDLNRGFTAQSQAIYDIPRMASLGFTVDF